MHKKDHYSRSRASVEAGGCLLGALAILLVVLILRERPRAAVHSSERASRFARFASPAFPLDRGRALVAFFTTDCRHCEETARQIALLDTGAIGLSVYFVFLGDREQIEPFFDTTGTRAPYRMTSADVFFDFVEVESTALFLLEEGRVRAQWAGSAFNLDALIRELSEAGP